jgi:hypothetical protein
MARVPLSPAFFGRLEVRTRPALPVRHRVVLHPARHNCDRQEKYYDLVTDGGHPWHVGTVPFPGIRGRITAGKPRSLGDL